jgi:hypothetical protein
MNLLTDLLAIRVSIPAWLMIVILVLGTYYWAVDIFR